MGNRRNLFEGGGSISHFAPYVSPLSKLENPFLNPKTKTSVLCYPPHLCTETWRLRPLSEDRPPLFAH